MKSENKCINCGINYCNNKRYKFCSVKCSNTYNNAQRINPTKDEKVVEKIRLKVLANFDNRLGPKQTFNVACAKCQKHISIIEREKQFPKKEKYFCSASCRNTRVHSKETKEKIGKKSSENGHDPVLKKCEYCTSEFTIKWSKRNQRFCSLSCSSSWIGFNTNRNVKSGLASAKIQSENRRSKNEIHFGDLCKEKFPGTLFNESMFNGWDADVVIPELKIAILWNGKWHYEKITKKHSVAQVQNRDRIKLNEIEKCGYKSYVIKDMGRENKQFVENEFNTFLNMISPHK